jgi:hypothetical protein
VGDIKVFYDVENEVVEILAIITKARAQRWLAGQGAPNAKRGADEGEG